MKEYFIYKITNPKGKIYIGQTKNPKKRPLEYRWEIKGQVKIYRSIKKYGFENHIIEVFLEKYTKEEVNKEEIKLIKHYKNKKISLNIADGGTTSSKLRTRKVIKFDLLGNKLQEYESVKSASNSVGCTSDVIVKALKSNLYYSKGFLFIYKDDHDKGVIPTWSAKDKGNSTISRKIYQFNLEGILLNSFNSIEEGGKILKIKPSAISANLRGITKRCKQFMFNYSNKIEKYIYPKNNKNYEKSEF